MHPYTKVSTFPASLIGPGQLPGHYRLYILLLANAESSQARKDSGDRDMEVNDSVCYTFVNV
jgi:hypothetical protein